MAESINVDGLSEQEGYNLIGEWLESVAFDEESKEDFPTLDPEDDDEPEDVA